MKTFALTSSLFIALFAGGGDSDKPWTNTTDLALALADGNAAFNRVGFANAYLHRFGKNRLTFKLSALNAAQTNITRYVTGDEDDPRVEERRTDELTAERLEGNVQYYRTIGKQLYLFATLDWERNEFAGIRGRTVTRVGLGTRWIDRESLSLATGYSLPFNQENTVHDLPGQDGEFLAYGVSYRLYHKPRPGFSYEHGLDVMVNSERTDDVRVVFEGELSLLLNGRVSLRLRIDAAYDNRPAFEFVPTGDGRVIPFPLEKWDLTFTTSMNVSL